MKSKLRISDLAILILALFLILFFARQGKTQIVDCQPTSGGFTVFLSQPAYAPNALNDAKQLQKFMQRLQFELDQERDGLWIHSPSTKVQFVVCSKRAPELDGHEFVPPLIESMHNQRVLLEIWGGLDSEPDTGGEKLTAQMNYLLVPVKFATNQNEITGPNALQRLLYSGKGAASVTDFVDLIARPQDIDAFVAASFGFKLLREHNYDLAYGNLCRAGTLLKKVGERKMPAGTLKEMEGLQKFVIESAARAVSDARTDPKYAKDGLLRLQDPKQPCPGEE